MIKINLPTRLVLAFFIFGIFNSLQAEQIYENHIYGYTVSLPNNWEYIENNKNYLSIKSPGSLGSECAIFVEKEDKSYNNYSELVSYFKNELFETEGSQSTYKIDTTEKVILNNESYAVKLYINNTLNEAAAKKLNIETNLTSKEITLYAINNGNSYHAVCYTPLGDSESNKIYFYEKIIDSFNFLTEK